MQYIIMIREQLKIEDRGKQKVEEVAEAGTHVTCYMLLRCWHTIKEEPPQIKIKWMDLQSLIQQCVQKEIIDLTVCVVQREIRSMCNMRNRAMPMLLWALLFLCLFSTSRAIWITIPASGAKCVSEEVHTNILVLGDFVVVSAGKDSHNSTVSLKVLTKC